MGLVERAARHAHLAGDLRHRHGHQQLASSPQLRRQVRQDGCDVELHILAFARRATVLADAQVMLVLADRHEALRGLVLADVDVVVQRARLPPVVADLLGAVPDQVADLPLDEPGDEGVVRRLGGVELRQALEQVEDEFLLDVLDVVLREACGPDELPVSSGGQNRPRGGR